MRLSTKGRYGVKAMLDLALHYSKGRIPLKSIAERQEISENYLEQLFAVLRKEGLVKSIRGSQGGYVLAKEAGAITVGQILRALEGTLAPVECVTETNPKQCKRSNLCVIKPIWEKIRDRVNDVVDSITLQDLIENYIKLNKKDDCVYNI